MASFLSGLSTFTSAVGSIQQGRAMRKAEAYNAAIKRQEAEAVRRQSELDIYQQRKRAQRFRATQEARYAKAGVLLGGSPLEVIMDSAADAELDMKITEYNAQVGVARAISQSRYHTFLGRQYASAGYMGAGRTLLTYGSKLLEKEKKEK